MKGHLYNDFILNKFAIFVAAGYSLLFIIFLFFSSDEINGIQSAMFLAVLLILWLNGGIVGIVQAKGKTRQLAITFPQGKKGYVLSKYIFCVLMTVAGIICGGICVLASGAMPELKTIIMIINIGFVFLWVELAFTLIFGENFGSSVLVVLLITAVFLATAYMLFGNLTFLVELTMEDVYAFLNKLSNNIAVYSTIANLAVLFITFPLSCKWVC